MNIVIIIVVLSVLAILLLLYGVPSDVFPAISRFFGRHRGLKMALSVLLVMWLFGTFILPLIQNEDKYPKAMIAYQKDGPVLEFEIPKGVAPKIEILDSIVARTGKEKTYVGVVYSFQGTLYTSLVGGKFLTKYFGWLMPEKSKWDKSHGTKKNSIIEGSRLEFKGGPPYTVEVLTGKKKVSFDNNPIYYRIIE